MTDNIQTPSPPSPVFRRERHVKYHLRCLKTLLPTLYTSNDANRMSLAFFTLASLDLLNALDESITSEERAGFVEWIYACQLDSGGFRSFPGTDFGANRRNDANKAWDPANLAGTLFALLNLLILGDDLEKVKRKQTLELLARWQLGDGSFGEVLGADGVPVGGRDMRHAYMAVCIRHILKGDSENLIDIDIEALVTFILTSQVYDGGFAKEPFHESHAGYSYCGISALSLLNRLARPSNGSDSANAATKEAVDLAVKWLVSRQIPTTDQVDESDEDEDDDSGIDDIKAAHPVSEFKIIRVHPASHSKSSNSLLFDHESLLSAGFNGRCNKPEDTCYSFWVVGSLDVLRKAQLIDCNANRHFLLNKTQHIIGGFSKVPGQPPDVLHSYFGLAALSLMSDSGFKKLASSLSISWDCAQRIQMMSWKR